MIRAIGVTKIYKIYEKPSSRLKELVLRKPFHREFVALRDISFEVSKGMTVGIIGENGAGKSTLLKILAGVLKPTLGRVEMNGMVSSLLELGAGFHPEFSGIENVYFYGSLLGFSRDDIKDKIEEIVDFSELGDFVNMPVKTYSSGMYVRLAFSVATAVDPDILIIDEALSVGDLHFQKKSTDKILEYKKRGKTIVFCSHSMYHVNLLCDKVIWIKHGIIEKVGEAFDVTSAFESYQRSKDVESKGKPFVLDKTIPVYIEDVEILNGVEIRSGDTLKLKISVDAFDGNLSYGLAVSLRRNDNVVIHTVGSFYDNVKFLKGKKVVYIEYPDIPLLAGNYYFVVYLMDSNLVNIYQEKLSQEFRVIKERIDPGLCYLNHRWIIED